MNLVRVQIQNFKQYIEPVDVEISPQATIGVIGANGVGKTTLFQAIEWCLYNPTTIASRDIRPRGRSGNPKVTVTLESRDGSRRWIVERELKKVATTAAIYEVDAEGTETKIVDSTREVTKYVTNRLIDLDHRAFVATFFTRQKELHFFGDLSDTDRRREVGKLLGLETIRTAQKHIGEDRTQATGMSRHLQQQYEQERQERDLDAELAAAEAELTESRAAIVTAKAAEATTIAATAAARQQRESLLALQERHRELSGQLDRLRADLATARQRREDREREIARLRDLAQQRGRLEPVAARLDDLQQQLAAAEVQRERHRHQQDLLRQRETAQQGMSRAVTAIGQEVSAVPAIAAPAAWQWSDPDTKAPENGVNRLRGVAATWPVADLQQRVTLLTTAKAAAEHADSQQRKLDTWHQRLAALEKEADEAMRDGDPQDAITAIEKEITDLRDQESGWQAERRGLEQERQKRQRVLDNIRNAEFGDGCPTCGRPFSEHDEHDVTELFTADIERIWQQVLAGDTRSKAAAARIAALTAERAGHEQRAESLRNLWARIETGTTRCEEQKAETETAVAALNEALAAAELTAAPGREDIERAEQEAALARSLHEAMGRIEIHLSGWTTQATTRDTIEQELAQLGEVAFDQVAYEALAQQREMASKAQVELRGLDRQLEALPVALEELDATAAAIDDLEQQVTTQEQEVAAVGFDPAALESARAAVTTAESGEREAASQRQQAELAHQRAESNRDGVIRDKERIDGLATRADAKRREADELDQMYRLFAEFEQYVVSRLTPALSELTSELVRQVTDGRYDDVTFDDNFGIMVRDGDENPFPLATFSGGERDVIALAARLALSQMIGQQAAEQPGFLVLDEVFGSLDRDRRNRLLELLGALASVSDRFQQVFMISHVDDVRTAPVFDELWMVRETAPGSSHIENLTAGTDIGEL